MNLGHGHADVPFVFHLAMVPVTRLERTIDAARAATRKSGNWISVERLYLVVWEPDPVKPIAADMEVPIPRS
jgi:hypothetical protein